VTEHFSFTHLVLVGALANVVLGLVTLVVIRRLGRERLGPFALVEVAAVTGVFALVQLLMVDDGFGKIHVLYLWVFLTLPVLGAALVVSSFVPTLRPTRWGMIGAAGLMALGAVGLYATHVEPRWIRTERVSLDVDGVPTDEPLRIGVLSDLQTDGIGDYEWDAVHRLMGEEPDLILVAGDYFQSDEALFLSQLEELRDLLGTLSAPGGVFLVQGDVDSPERMALMTAGQDLEWLDHAVATTEVDGLRVAIGGIPPSWDSPESRATIDDLAATTDVDLRILLSHRPDAVFEVPADGADLVVAGHTHGGQLRLPIIGPVMTMSGIPRHIAAGGLHAVDGIPIYLSNGVGVERAGAPQFRLGDRPSVGIVTLT
jgi:predicted MPP superfamily phosphohydrolase